MLSIALLGSLARATPRVLSWLAGRRAGVRSRRPRRVRRPVPTRPRRARPGAARQRALAGPRQHRGQGRAARRGRDRPARSAPASGALPARRAVSAGRACASGARRASACAARKAATPWNVYLPITVKVYGRAVVVPAGADAGSTLAAADLSRGRGRPGRGIQPRHRRREGWRRAASLAQSIKPGQTLRQAQLKARQWFAAGDTVKVVASGDGFALEAEGQALNTGIEGQPAKVRTESGRVLTGIAVGRAAGRGGAVRQPAAAPTGPRKSPKVAPGDADSPSMLMGAQAVWRRWRAP